MLVFSQVRGPHSTGIGSVDRFQNNKTVLAKVVGRPGLLIDFDKRYDQAMDFSKKFILGHNRFATTGKINQKNAHPFNFENILGCHNGTIPEHRLRLLKVDYNNYGTDSEAVLAAINEHPLEEVFRNLAGAWAFVWFDRRDDSVNFLRNSNRSLYYTYSSDRQELFWASEGGIIRAALDRNDLKRDKIYELPPDVHFKWKIPLSNKAFDAPEQTKVVSNEWSAETWHSANRRFPLLEETSKELDKEETSKKGLVVVNKVIDLRHNNKFYDANTHETQVTKPHEVIERREVQDFSEHNSAELKDFDGQGYLRGKKNSFLYRGFRGEQLNKVQFEEVTKEGCSWCSSSAEWGKPVRFLGVKEHLCLECNSDPEIVQFANAI